MWHLLKKNKGFRQQAFAAGFFHFIHAFTTILLLLMVGQIISQSDSTKSRLLQILLLGNFNAAYQWYWVIGLLIIKFIGTAFRNYFLPLIPFKIQITLQDYRMESSNQKNDFITDKDIKNYGRAYVKGYILWIADLFLLLLIFLLLFHLDVWVAFFWLLLWVLGIIIRWWVVHYYLRAKRVWKETLGALQRKWKFIMLNRSVLKIDQQWKKEVRILKRREVKAEDAFRSFGFQKAWTSGFFPVYFFGFVFLLAWMFKGSENDQTIILQIILIIIYSQGALMRSFRAPEYWRVIRGVEKKWDSKLNASVNTPNASITNDLADYVDSHIKDLISLSKQEWEKILPFFYSEEKNQEKFYKTLFRKVSLIDSGKPLVGETYLSAILSDKEAVQMPVLNDLLSVFDNNQWENFNWKRKAERTAITEKQYIWLCLFKSLLHPGDIILCKDDLSQKLDQRDLDNFITLIEKRNKKIIYLYA
jgi:hypothetical protein